MDAAAAAKGHKFKEQKAVASPGSASGNNKKRKRGSCNGSGNGGKKCSSCGGSSHAYKDCPKNKASK
jgi:hypothetical protein